MAKSNKKKTIEVTKSSKKKTSPVASIRKSSASGANTNTLLFGKENYKFMLIGIGLIALGMILMMGGSMPSPDVWDESIIYSPIRTVISPILILAGLGIQFFAIFKKA